MEELALTVNSLLESVLPFLNVIIPIALGLFLVGFIIAATFIIRTFISIHRSNQITHFPRKR